MDHLRAVCGIRFFVVVEVFALLASPAWSADRADTLVRSEAGAVMKSASSGVGTAITSQTLTDLRHLPVRGFAEYVGLQPGVVELAPYCNDHLARLSVREGYSSEVAYYVDGFSVQDPATGLSAHLINHNVIDAVSLSSGYFGPQFGNAMSGIAEVGTQWSDGEFHGTMEAITDNFHGDSYDYNLYSTSVAGSVPNTNIYYMGSLQRQWLGDIVPRSTAAGILPNNHSGNWAWQSKLMYQPTTRTSLSIGTLGSQTERRHYLRSFHFNSEHAPRSEFDHNSFWGQWRQQIGSNSELVIGSQWAEFESVSGDGVLFDDLWAYGRPSGNPANDETDLFRSWDDLNGATETEYTTLEVAMPDGSTQGIQFISGGDEGHLWDDLEKRHSSFYGGKLAFNTEVNQSHAFNIGGEFQRHTLRYYRHLFPSLVFIGEPGGFRDIDRYGYDALGDELDDDGLNGVKHPISAAGYVNDRFTIGELTVNAGLRLDYFDHRSQYLRDPTNPLDPDNLAERPNPTVEQLLESQRLTGSDLKPSESMTRLSPRISATLPAGENSTLLLGYGRYVQRPFYANVYTNFDYLEYKVKTGGYDYAFGNPNLQPEVTTTYELGWQQRITNVLSARATLYQKNIDDLVVVANVPARPNNFTMVVNSDATSAVRGIEMQVDLRPWHGLSGQLNYTLQSGDVDGLSYWSSRNVAWTATEPPPSTDIPRDLDRPHNLVGFFSARTGALAGPAMGSTHPFGNLTLGTVIRAASGFPYSPTAPFNEVTLGTSSPALAGEFNSERMPAYFRIDLKLTKAVAFAGTDWDIYLWVVNVLDRENAVEVYSSTGEPDNTGWLETGPGKQFVNDNAVPTDNSGLTGEGKYRLAQRDPLNFDTPRQIRLGVRLAF